MADAFPGKGRWAGATWAVGAPLDPGAVLDAAGLAPGEVVGVGPRGATVRARRQGDGRLVALKVGAPLGSERIRRRFLDDAAVVQRLPALSHVAPVVDAGVSPDGRPWLLTPWYDGGSVAERLRQGPLAVSEAVDAGRHAAAALAGLHQAGLLHANLTPAAMLRDAFGEVWVDGMALSTLAPDAPAGTGAAPAHVPPEVLEGSPWSAPGDVWALGSCLHTMLVGQPPWARTAPQGPVALLLAMAMGEPPGLARPEVPSWLTALVAACLAVDPAGRPTAAGLLARIERAVPSPSDTLLPADTLLPRSGAEPEGRPLGSSYLLLEPIGSGASGQVWRGRRRWDGSAVAVKVLRPELGSDPEAVVRFLRERATLVGLDHPNLVRVLDLVAEGETLAIVMDLVEGPNLRRVLTGRGAPPAEEACRLLAQVASGLAFVHRAGVVHRDLKPENVLVERPGTPLVRARLTDFGVARTLAGPAVAGADQLLGTAGYLAPELIAGRPLTSAVDVYSLGVLSYELLSGRPPFEAEHPGALLRAHLELEPTRPAGLSDATWDLVARCLAKDPEDRPDAAAAGAQLARLAADPTAPGAPGAPVGPPPNPAFRSPPPAAPPPAGPPAPVAGWAPPPAASLAPLAPPSPPAADEHATHVSERPLPPAPPSDPGPGRTRGIRGWSTRARVGALAAVVVVAAGAGAAATLLDHGSAPGHEAAADVTARVTATPAGAVTVSWADEHGRPGFVVYLLRQDGTISQSQPAPGTTTLTLDGVPAGRHCFRVDAVFSGRLPPGLAGPKAPAECVPVP